MPRRTIELGGERWEVSLAGSVTQFVRDEITLLFTRTGGGEREQRLLRFSPLGAKGRELAFGELSDAELTAMLRRAQPSWTAAETGYRK